MKQLLVSPVGVVVNEGKAPRIEIDRAYVDALLGLDGFSHINVLYWFHQNDTLDKRRILQVHPRGNPENPLTGVFATHSPVRPNLIALTRCRIRSIDGARILLDEIDALDGSPVLDIKGYFPDADDGPDIRLPDWA